MKITESLFGEGWGSRYIRTLLYPYLGAIPVGGLT